jgi:2-keto-3-deoxy-L-rhamnonate aldolase RhmA
VAVDNVDSIAAVPDVDVLFIGPCDLSYDLGIPGQLDSPLFHQTLTRVVDAVQRAGICAGILTGSRNWPMHIYLEQGFTFVAAGSDDTFITSAARSVNDDVRERRSRVPAPTFDHSTI